MRFFFLDEGHTLASVLRAALEQETDDDGSFASCEQMHYLDTHLEVHAPDEATLRRALLRAKDQVAAARRARLRLSSA